MSLRQEAYERDRRESDLFIPHLKAILGSVFFQIAPVQEDLEHNTDLIVFRMRQIGRIACRVRDLKYLETYGHQFTIRAGRPSGVDTELQKILNGWGDYTLYGFGNKETKRVVRWAIGDLNIFRAYWPRLWQRGLGGMEAAGDFRWNHDGSSALLALYWDDFPADFVVARHHPQKIPAAPSVALRDAARQFAASTAKFIETLAPTAETIRDAARKLASVFANGARK